MSGWWPWALKGAITVWLVGISVWDRRHRRVPNWLVLPGMFGALLFQIALAMAKSPRTSPMTAGSLGFALASWVVLFLMWQAHFFGGGDAKLLMALFCLFPTRQFLLLFAIVVFAVTVPLLIAQLVQHGGQYAVQELRERIGQHQLMPTAEDLQTKGRPHCWSLALPGSDLSMARLVKSRRGAVTVQVALFLPILIVILVGAFEFWKVQYLQQVLNDAAYQGVRLLVSQANAPEVEGMPVRDMRAETEMMIRRYVATQAFSTDSC